jgi:Double-GTPase 2
MDDLVGGLALLVAAACVAMVLIAAAMAVVAASAVVGSSIVGGQGALVFTSELGRRVKTRGGADRKPRPPEPAFELYALSQMSRDIRHSGEQAWVAMLALRQKVDVFAARYMEGAKMPLGIGAIIGGYVGLVLGAVVCFVLMLPVLLVAGIAIAGAWLLIFILRGAEAVRRRIRRTSYECPVDHERFPLPVYICPGCAAEHHRLVPGRWGIRRRECQCGKIGLPTMVLNGRQRVPQRCPNGHALDGIIGFSEIVRVALIAGPRAGKTTFLAGAMTELDRLSKSGTLALSVVDGSKSDYDEALEDLAHGRLPPKTQLGTSPALVAEVQGEGRSRILSLYDVAGESFIGDDSVRTLRFLELPSGFVLLVDPLSLDRFATDHEEEIASAEDRLRPSPVAPTRVLETTLGALSEAGADGQKIPVAVVVGKADALNVGAQIDALAAKSGDRAVATWLEQQGAGNFVRIVESSFQKVGWFHASALGRVPDPSNRKAFVPEGTAAPLLWLLQQNGVTPADGAFSPTQQAQKLSGAQAADFALAGARGSGSR